MSTRIEPSALSRPSSEIYRYELGISAGVGSQFQLSTKAAVFLDVRYTSGLTNVWKNSLGLFSQRDSLFPDFYHTVLSFNTGILF